MKVTGWDTACSVCTAGASVVCMSSMAAALAAAGTAAGAVAAGMAGMSTMSSTGGIASPTVEAQALPLLPGVLERLGLGFLNGIPNEILQPLLIVLLTVSVATAYLGYRGHGRPYALALTLGSAVVMYVSIYVWMSDPLYLFSLIGLIGAGLWGMYLARHPALTSIEPSSV